MGRLLDYYSSDKTEREELRARSAKPDAKPAPPANVEEFFPWHTDFRDETSYLESVLGKDALDVSSEAEDRQCIEQNEENLFLSAVNKLSVRKI